jgi:uncharacterized oligopeptide transporter (OPT) family protein
MTDPAKPPAIDSTPLRDPEAIAARDARWRREVYVEGAPQLTVRALLTGVVLGGILSASNLYIGLKIGWSFGMGLTTAVVGFALWAAIRRTLPSLTPFGILENNVSQTAASAAAYMSSAGLVSSIPAMTMLRRDGIGGIPELGIVAVMAWMLAISLLGVVVAVPLKRNLINAEQLRFPSGVVTAETMKTMHAAGRESLQKARALFGAAGVAGVLKLVVESKRGPFAALPEVVALPRMLAGQPLSAWSLGLNTSLLLYGAGAIIGLKVGVSLLVGALVTYAGIGPWLLGIGALQIAPPEVARDPAAWLAFQRSAEAVHAIPVRSPELLHVVLRSKWTVWPGTALMVSASLVAFALRWKTIARAFSGLSAGLRRKNGDDPLADVEVPGSWFGIGLVGCAIACVVMQKVWFGVPILEGTVSVVAAFFLSVVAARATGETGITPIGAMGKITQLLFGVLVPGNAAANLMTATVTAGAASHSADLLTEVKSGYLLGASPRKQFWAQIVGVFAGTLVCVPIYFLIAKPERLGTELAAPAAVAWASVAKLLKDGWRNLPMLSLAAIAVASAIGVAIALLEEVGARTHAANAARAASRGEPAPKPPRWLSFVPSATGLGIAMVIDANDSIAMFLGAAAAAIVVLRSKAWAERYTVSLASGAVAGEGVMGIVVIALRDVFHVL